MFFGGRGGGGIDERQDSCSEIAKEKPLKKAISKSLFPRKFDLSATCALKCQNTNFVFTYILRIPTLWNFTNNFSRTRDDVKFAELYFHLFPK